MPARLLLLFLLAGQAAPGAERVLLLVENRSGNAAAIVGLLPQMTSALARRGYEVTSEAQAPLHPEELGRDEARKLLVQAKAGTVLAVTIRFSLPQRPRGRGPPAGAALGLTATAFSSERVIWRGTFGAIADPIPGQLPLANHAVARLLWSFPRAPGAGLASIANLDEPEAVTAARTRASTPPDYDAPIERLRSRSGPRFPLRMRKKEQ